MSDEVTGLNSGNTGKVKIGALASEAVDFTIANARVLGRLALFPFIASVAVVVIYNSFPNTSWIYLFSQAVKFCAMGMFAVAVHRFYILGQTPKIGLGIQEIKFVLFASVTTALWFVPLEFTVFAFQKSVEAMQAKADTSAGNVLGSFAFVGVLFYAVLRLSLVFPLIAIGEPGTLVAHIKYSWQKMRGNVLAFVLSAFVISFVIGLFTGLPTLIVEAIFGSVTENYTTAFIVTSLGLCAGFLYSLFLVLFASYIFQKTKSAGLN